MGFSGDIMSHYGKNLTLLMYMYTVVLEHNLQVLPVPVCRLPASGTVLQVTGTV